MPSKFNKRSKKQKSSRQMSTDFPSFYDFAKPIFNMLADEFAEEGLVDEAEDMRNALINPKERIKKWNEMVLSLPEEFPTITNETLKSLTKARVQTILRSIAKIEELSSEGEDYYDKLEKLSKKLVNSFLKWLDLLDDQYPNKNLFDPGFVIEIFLDFAFNYEGEFESSLLYCESFLCSHFIRKTWAEDKTYLWAPFTIFYFLNFLYIHKIIEDPTFDLAMKSLIEIKEKFYTFYGRYIDPNDAESVLDEMMFL